MDKPADSDVEALWLEYTTVIARYTSALWILSPERALLTSILNTEALALQLIEHRPDTCSDVLARLRQSPATVEAATADAHGETPH